MDAWPTSTGEALHTSTYLGHPIGCAMALAALAEHARPETVPTPCRRRVKSSGRRSAQPALARVSGTCVGAGLMLGVELVRRDGSPVRHGSPWPSSRRRCATALILLGGRPGRETSSRLTPPVHRSTDEEIGFRRRAGFRNT